MITIFIPGEPPRTTAQQKGQNRKTGQYYKPAELKDAEQKYMAYAAQARPEQPLDGPIRLSALFVFDGHGRHKDGEWKITKPDTDNMIKALKDALTRVGFWRDDAQVVCETTMKVWGSQPGVLMDVGEP